jgi:hypothetical protein
MLLNLVAFNCSWLGLVLFGNLAIPFVVLWLFIHIYFSKNYLSELKLILTVTIIGICVDSTLVALGVFKFHVPLLLPLWLIVLWSAFAGTIAHSLNFLNTSTKLQFIAGFVFPPLSYLAGASLSKVEFGYSAVTTYLILAPLWACLFVAIFWLKNSYYRGKTIHD